VPAPLEVRYRRELLVNNEKFLTGQAARLSNGVKVLDPMLLPEHIREKILLIEEVINFPTSLLSHKNYHC
jgi:hypothetical protein